MAFAPRDLTQMLDHFPNPYPLPAPWPPEWEAMQAAILELIKDGGGTAYPGRMCGLLERQIAACLGRQHVQLTCSGTAALEIGLRAAGIGHGDLVLLGAYDYPGNFRCVESVGAIPRTLDAHSGRWDLDWESVGDAIPAGTKAIVASYLHGLAPDFCRLRQFTRDRSLLLIEDACQAIGGSCQGKPCGSWGDFSCLSFGGSKLLTAGNGGALLTDDDRLAQKARVWNERPAPTFSLSEIAAAMLLPQFETLERRHQQRRTNVARLREVIREANCWKLPRLLDRDADVADYKLAWLVKGSDRAAILAKASAWGLPLGAGFSVFKRIALGTIDRAQIAAHTMVVLDHRAFTVEAEELTGLIQRLRELAEFSAQLE